MSVAALSLGSASAVIMSGSIHLAPGTCPFLYRSTPLLSKTKVLGCVSLVATSSTVSVFSATASADDSSPEGVFLHAEELERMSAATRTNIELRMAATLSDSSPSAQRDDLNDARGYDEAGRVARPD